MRVRKLFGVLVVAAGVVVAGLWVPPAPANTTSPCVSAGQTLLAGEAVGFGPAGGLFGGRDSSPVQSPEDGSTWTRNPYYASGTTVSSQFAVVGFRFTNPAGHACTGFTYTITRFDGMVVGPYQIGPRAGGTFLLAGTSYGGGAASFVAGTATCSIKCGTCPCTCDSMSFTLL
jgi:hypothetical protein